MSARWIHCPKCGHRLFYNKGGTFEIEIKCPSCKNIMTIDQNVEGGKYEKVNHRTNSDLVVDGSCIRR